MRSGRLLTLAAAAYVVLVAAIELLGLGLSPDELGSSPDSLVSGEVWHLLTSALLVDGEVPLFQLALLAAVTAAVILRHGPRIWWAASLLGHVGSALLAYVAIGIAIALGDGAADAISDDWDYGVSCVMAAQFGVLFAGALLHRRRGRGDAVDLLLIGAACVAFAFYLATIDWYGIEHPLAFAIGAAVLLVADRRAPSARPS
ncbi:MAG TPA: hypothetical protein VLK58_28180 [Conexibacter sp.]|nr:hypothetical protein [Conexibacter sp.]